MLWYPLGEPSGPPVIGRNLGSKQNYRLTWHCNRPLYVMSVYIELCCWQNARLLLYILPSPFL
jgi:hypothetical protein